MGSADQPDQPDQVDHADDLFKALADPGRRRLLDRLAEDPGQNLHQLCGELDMARQSVSKHLAKLESAGLVTTTRRGREKLHYLNAAPINDIAQRWISRYHQPRIDALSDLKKALEHPTMTSESAPNPSFTYTTFIQASPEQMWAGLTDPAFTERYWGTALESDWTVGSPIVWHHHGVTISDPDQVVLEADPYRRLSYTWHTFTPEWAAAHDFSDEDRARLAGEQRSRVTFDIEPVGGAVKLTLLHDGFGAGSLAAELVSGGWPQVMSSLKTLLETDQALQIA
jgi:uncharacterized protein YndB with AHSA1/START domain/DNA-binding transcriptional ArsR family regulator